MKKKPELTIYDQGPWRITACPHCAAKERRARRLHADQKVRDVDVEEQVAGGFVARCDYCEKKARVDWFRVKILAERRPSDYMMPSVKEAQDLCANPWEIYSSMMGYSMTFTVEFRINGEAFRTMRYGYGSSPEDAARHMESDHGETLRALDLVGKRDSAEFVTTKVEVNEFYSGKKVAEFDLPL